MFVDLKTTKCFSWENTEYSRYNFPESVFPIHPLTKNITVTLPNRNFNTTIKQLPISVSVAATMYKLQGETVKSVFIPSFRGKGENRSSLYVMLSRIKSLKGLFTSNLLSERDANFFKPQKSLLDEHKRLLNLDKKTCDELDLILGENNLNTVNKPIYLNILETMQCSEKLEYNGHLDRNLDKNQKEHDSCGETLEKVFMSAVNNNYNSNEYAKEIKIKKPNDFTGSFENRSIIELLSAEKKANLKSFDSVSEESQNDLLPNINTHEFEIIDLIENNFILNNNYVDELEKKVQDFHIHSGQYENQNSLNLDINEDIMEVPLNLHSTVKRMYESVHENYFCDTFEDNLEEHLHYFDNNVVRDTLLHSGHSEYSCGKCSLFSNSISENSNCFFFETVLETSETVYLLKIQWN